MAVDFAAAFQNGVSDCYDKVQMQAVVDQICFPCAGEGGAAGGCFQVLPSGTPVSQFPLLGWGNEQPDPAECPFLAVVVDCTLYLAPNDPTCAFLDPSIWVKIGGFVSAPKAQFAYQSSQSLPSTPDNGWFELPLGTQEFNSMSANLTAVGNTFILTPGSYIIHSVTDYFVRQNISALKVYTRLFDITHGVVVKQSNKAEMSGVVNGTSSIGIIDTTLQNHFRTRVAPTGITTYRIEHMSVGSDPGTFKITAENNELYIERDS